jgi:hypothetical protein
MIDKMVNCTAAERQASTRAVYGNYMDGIKPIIFNEGSDLSGLNFIKWTIGPFGAHFLFEYTDKSAESYFYTHLWQKVCAPVLLCFNSNFLISDNNCQDRYSG